MGLRPCRQWKYPGSVADRGRGLVFSKNGCYLARTPLDPMPIKHRDKPGNHARTLFEDYPAFVDADEEARAVYRLRWKWTPQKRPR